MLIEIIKKFQEEHPELSKENLEFLEKEVEFHNNPKLVILERPVFEYNGHQYCSKNNAAVSLEILNSDDVEKVFIWRLNLSNEKITYRGEIIKKTI